MTIAISEKHKRELSPERDFPTPTPVTMRYAILSSPRSGSTLLGRLLHETKQAGDPQEYFNPPLLALARKQYNKPELTINQFLREMQKRRTSPNGVFGLKTHYSQLLGVFRTKKPTENVAKFLREAGKLIWIRRRDRIGQAISQAVAIKTNVWSSEDTRFQKNPDVKIHPFEIIRTLQVISHDDAGWEMLIPAAKLEVLEVWYEDLVNDYENQARRVLRYLGIDKDVPTIPAPPLERQGGELNERLRREFHAYLGLPPPAA
ncbi:Stf0 family sulfotransferase [Ramlibacter sp. PS4R-6]|uniref:Stf0 family sulfotransferase n=1 Tax=Ramlibacter sp. PS4R-6 TaxID=3133438 RepID=UPI00309F6CB0